jgi:hypothetical protein
MPRMHYQRIIFERDPERTKTVTESSLIDVKSTTAREELDNSLLAEKPITECDPIPWVQIMIVIF